MHCKNHVINESFIRKNLRDVFRVVALLFELLQPHSYREGDLREADTL
jgi:hypothetical protein